MTERQVPVSWQRYEAYSHEAMYAEATNNNNPADVGGIGAEWASLAASLAESAQEVRTMSGNTAEGWQGESGDAMRTRLASMAKWSDEAAEVAGTLAIAVNKQAEIAARALREMPEPVPYDPGQMIRSAVSSGSIFELCSLPNEMALRQAASEAARQKAIDELNTRNAALHAAAPHVSFPPSTRA